MGPAMWVAPRSRRLLRLRVLRSERITPHFQRVTLGGGTIADFAAAGWGQWLRIFLPTHDETDLDRLPDRVSLPGYLRYLAIRRDRRPVERDYAVRGFRPIGREGPELDIDFVLHGRQGPASAWAQSCRPGDRIGLVDAGAAFDPARGSDHVLLVADETGVPAVASVLASLPADATGTAVLEVPSIDDAVEVPHPDGVEVAWLSREDEDPPGLAAIEAARAASIDRSRVHAFLAGERSLARDLRRHLLASGVPRVRISSSGYWRLAAEAPDQSPTDS